MFRKSCPARGVAFLIRNGSGNHYPVIPAQAGIYPYKLENGNSQPHPSISSGWAAALASVYRHCEKPLLSFEAIRLNTSLNPSLPTAPFGRLRVTRLRRETAALARRA
ncbi:MAG: hypothetical protein F9K23_17650 [Bacteroidetes bacterium]|nr:MAG: hypothetical protein F9K23_17650 [Bacteroidota bacterium]